MKVIHLLVVVGLGASLGLACGSGSSDLGDGGASSSGASSSGASSSGASSSGTSDAGVGDVATSDGSTVTSDAGVTCTRDTSLDDACAMELGTQASKGYACPQEFFKALPCAPLRSRGCTEVCTNP